MQQGGRGTAETDNRAARNELQGMTRKLAADSDEVFAAQSKRFAVINSWISNEKPPAFIENAGGKM